MSNQFKALQIYFNNKNIPLMMGSEFIYLKRAGYKINGKKMNLSDYEKLSDLSTRADKEANEVMSEIYKVIKSDPTIRKHCKHTNTSIENKKFGWSFTLQMKEHSRNKSKMHFSINIELDFDHEANPAIIASLWCPKTLGKQINIWDNNDGFDNEHQAQFDEYFSEKLSSKIERERFFLGSCPVLKRNGPKDNKQMMSINEIASRFKSDILKDWITYNKSKSIVARLTKGMKELRGA